MYNTSGAIIDLSDTDFGPASLPTDLPHFLSAPDGLNNVEQHPLLSAARNEAPLNTYQEEEEAEIPLAPLPPLSRRLRAPRYLLAAIGGAIHGLINTPIRAYKTLDTPKPESIVNSTLAYLLSAPYYFLKALLTHAYSSAKIWVESESNRLNDLDAEDESKAQTQTSQTPIQYGFLGYLKGLIGFSFGLALSFFAALSNLVRPQNEGLLVGLITIVPRFLSTLFSTSFEMAKSWATPNPSSARAAARKAEAISPRDVKHTELSGIFDYARVVVSALGGFIYGMSEAFFAALDTMINPPKDEALWYSLIFGVLRFLTTLFETPFLRASDWVEEERVLIDQAKNLHSLLKEETAHYQLSGWGYLRTISAGMMGFVAGLISAPANALDHTLNTPHQENLLTKLFLAPFRFFQALVLSAFMTAGLWVEGERDLLDAEAEDYNQSLNDDSDDNDSDIVRGMGMDADNIIHQNPILSAHRQFANSRESYPPLPSYANGTPQGAAVKAALNSGEINIRFPTLKAALNSQPLVELEQDQEQETDENSQSSSRFANK